MSSGVITPYPGIQVFENALGATVLRLHYTADPEKAAGEKIFVPELKLELSPWAYAEYKKMGSPGMFKQEYEIDGSATSGQLIYNLDPEATLEKSFPIPEDWTRYMSLDPHPQVPHAFLWCAVDPWGDRWYYRELWPSSVCFRYERGVKAGKAGGCPEEDNRFTIKEYVETVRYLESKENPQNRDKDGKAFDERIYKRVIDYAARAFGKGTSDDPEQPNFQQRYEAHMSGVCDCNPRCPAMANSTFEDAKKDHDAGYDCVNEGLRPMQVMGNDGLFRSRSRIHIFEDCCPETIYQLQNNRLQQLTSQQAAVMDPTGKALQVRNHETDNLRYIEMARPEYVPPPKPRESSWRPQVPGIAY